MSKKSPMTTEEFVRRSTLKHNNKYDYSNTTYVHYKTLVSITCYTHGEFMQNPMHHLRGNGCPKCAKEQDSIHKTKSAADVIQRFREVHGDRYDYTSVKYTGTHHKVEIVCSRHGSFYQKPNDHLHGTGCPTCANERATTSVEDFIARSTLMHGDRYDYSKVRYKNSQTKVEIVCPEHGSFFQLPVNHIAHGSGCPTCSSTRRGLKRRRSKEEFISQATTTHNNKYDYSKVVYRGIHHKVEIVCPEHGPFFQKASNHAHLSQGCPECSQYIGVYTEHLFNTKPELKDVSAVVYFVEFSKGDERFQKIGITQRTVAKRFQSKKGYRIVSKYEKVTTLYDAFKTEQYIKKTWSNRTYQPQVVIGGDSECFKLSEDECLEVIHLLRKSTTGL